MCNVRSAIVTLTACVLAALLGCGNGADLAGGVQVPPQQQFVLGPEAAQQAELELPGTAGFNIHVKQSSQNPAAQGQAKGNSDATSQGRAFAVVEGCEGGSASASFKIGQQIDNATGQFQAVSIELEYTQKVSVEAAVPPAPKTQATASLSLVILDSRKRVVLQLPLVQSDSDQAAGGVLSKEQRHTTARFEPNLTYSIMLVGSADVTTADTQKALARLEIEDLKMKLAFRATDSQPAQ